MDSQTQSPSKQPERFFDIVPANKTVPDTSSRPILVTNQPEQVDPMVNIPESPAVAEVLRSQATVETPTPTPPTIAEEPTPSPAPQAPIESTVSTPEPATPDSDSPLELPANKSPDVVAVHHGYSTRTLRNIITVLLILIMLVVIADLVLDIGYLKLALPHSHFFGT